MTLGVQLYTLRRECVGDVLGTLERVAAVGYRAVEWFGGTFGVPLETIEERLRSTGLEVLAVHVPLEELESRTGGEVERALALGCRHLVCPWLDERRRSGASAYEELGVVLDRLGGELATRGVRLSYHNHDFEIRPPSLGGPTEPDGLERLARSTSPDHLGFELDVYWLAFAGVDPAERIRRYADRVDLVHLKDGLLDRPAFRPLGQGEVELGAVLAAARDVGAQALIVEQDECDGSPYDAIAESLAALRRLLEGTPR